MAQVYDGGILFDPLYRDLMKGLEEIVQEAPQNGLTDVAVEIRKLRNDIKKEAIQYSTRQV